MAKLRKLPMNNDDIINKKIKDDLKNGMFDFFIERYNEIFKDEYRSEIEIFNDLMKFENIDVLFCVIFKNMLKCNDYIEIKREILINDKLTNYLIKNLSIDKRTILFGDSGFWSADTDVLEENNITLNKIRINNVSIVKLINYVYEYQNNKREVNEDLIYRISRLFELVFFDTKNRFSKLEFDIKLDLKLTIFTNVRMTNEELNEIFKD